jgi:hypothetical protein
MEQCSAFTALYNERKKDKDSGSGGRPKIDLLGNQARSKINAAKSKTAKRDSMRAVSKRPLSTAANHINVIAKVSFKQNSSQSRRSLSATINYNLDRERGIDEKERSLFTSKLSDLDRSVAKEEIERKFGENVAYHKIILSSGDNHVSQRDFARTVMAEWQRSIEKEFEYYAVEHRNTDYHHVHIIIPGKSSDRNGDLSFDREDIAALREIGGDYLARDRFMDRELDREIALEFERDKLDREVKTLFHMSRKDYEREQTGVGLQTYKEMREEQKELGLLFQYDSDRISKTANQQEKDSTPFEEISQEHSSEISNREDEADWDKDLGDKLVEQSEGEREFQNGEIEQEHSIRTRRQNDDE